LTLTYQPTSTPYTYVIGWSHLAVRYYGVRFAQGCDPAELWQTYFTSSQHVAQFCELHGDPDVLQIRKTFASTRSAQQWEHRVLRRLRVTQSAQWLNRTDNISIAAQPGDLNPARRPEVRAKISQSIKKIAKRGDEHPRRTHPEKYAHLSALLKGRRNYWQEGDLNPAKRPEVRAKLKGMQNSLGYRHTEAEKKRISQRFLGVPKNRVSCLCCRKEVGINTFPRWHGDNCKKPLNTQ
jgi:hypothetical protein